MPIFSQKNVRSLKKNCSYVVFFLILHEKPPAAMPILGSNKVISVKITLYIMGQIGQQDVRFFRFLIKNNCCYVHILSTKRLFSKNTTLSCPYFVKKYQFSKKKCSHIFFFKFIMKNLLLSYPYLVKKNVNSVKITPPYGPKMSIGYHFFPSFHEKITAVMLVFGKKMSIL